MSSNCSSYKCKVCYDAGKPATDYNSHYVKSLDRSKVTCPVILAIKCRYCGEMGHTLKYCAKLLSKEKKRGAGFQATMTSVATASNKAKNVIKASTIENMYSILDDDEDEDDQVEVQKSYADAVNAEPAPAAPPAPAIVILAIPKLVRNEPKRWADYSDSEEEDYYEI